MAATAHHLIALREAQLSEAETPLFTAFIYAATAYSAAARAAVDLHALALDALSATTASAAPALARALAAYAGFFTPPAADARVAALEAQLSALQRKLAVATNAQRGEATSPPTTPISPGAGARETDEFAALPVAWPVSGAAPKSAAVARVIALPRP